MNRACATAVAVGCTAIAGFAAVAAAAGAGAATAITGASGALALPLERHAVHAERIGDALRVNGLRVEAWRLTGTGLRPMVDDVARAWRSSDRHMDSRQGRWRIVARRHAGRGEVLQFDAGTGEALFSRLDPQWPVRAPAVSALLPAGCAAGGTVEEQGAHAALLQLSARCIADAATVASRVRSLADSKGWHEHRGAAGHALVFERAGVETRVFVEPGQSGGSRLVLVQWSPGRRR